MQNEISVPIPKGIRGIVFSTEIADTPANCNLRTGIVKINPDYWCFLNNDQRFYILAHEAGHIVLQTHDEHEADAYASKLYFEAKRSPKQSVYAMSKVLPFTTTEQSHRLSKQLIRAAIQDYKTTKNINALKILNKMNQDLNNELDEFEDSFLGDDEESFFGKNRAAKVERRENKKNSRIERKNEKSASKAALRQGKAEAKVLKAQSGQPGAGENIFQKVMQGVQTVGATVGAIKGGGAMGGEYSERPEEKKILGLKAGTFYIVAGVVVVVVSLGLYLVLKSKKSVATA